MTHYNTVRFRCRHCGKTITIPFPKRGPGFKVPDHMRAQIVTHYCLGDDPSEIVLFLKSSGIILDRSTAYRVIKAEEDSKLRALHRINRIRQLRRCYRDPDARAYYQGGAKALDPAELVGGISPHVEVVSAGGEKRAEVGVLRCVVLVVPVYRDSIARASFGWGDTLRWIDNFLVRVGGGGVLTYKSLRDLERDFDPSDEVPYWSLQDCRLGLDELQAPPDKRDYWVQYAVKLALRVKDVAKAFAKPKVARREIGGWQVAVSSVEREDICDNL